MNSFRKFLLTGMWTGYLKPAPGTWGSAAACGVFLLAIRSFGPDSWVLPACMGAIAILATIGCIALGDFAKKTFGKTDPHQCTLDEWAGQAVTLIALPLGGTWDQHWIAVGIAFVAFRVLDIIKPPPARQAEGLWGGIGIVADDLVAGVYANIISQLILRIIWIT